MREKGEAEISRVISGAVGGAPLAVVAIKGAMWHPEEQGTTPNPPHPDGSGP